MKMTEKEFLQTFYKHLQYYGNSPHTTISEDIDIFLQGHHKEYYEVEFIKKSEEENGGYVVGVDLAKEGAEGEVHTLYNEEGKVIGWSNLTAEELRKMYNEVNK